MKFYPVLLLPLVPLAAGQTFEDCVDCAGLLPDVAACFFDPNKCDLRTCDPDDLESCECFECLDPLFSCVSECIPDCVDGDALAYVQCVTKPENDCFNSCSGQVTGGAYTFPSLVPPEDCNLISFFADWSSCLPSWPTCDAVQEALIPSTCDATECCSACHEQLNNMQSCVYGWLSGSDCSDTFTCSPNRNLHFLKEQPRKLNVNDEPKFVQECHAQFAENLILNPGATFNDYMDCFITNANELTVDESNNPAENGNTTSGSFHVVMALPVVAVAWTLQFMW